MKYLQYILFVGFLLITGCMSQQPATQSGAADEAVPESTMQPVSDIAKPDVDPREGLAAGLFDAEETIWNLKKVSTTISPEDFIGTTNTDLAFKDNYVIQGNYNGFVVWDMTDPANPEVVVDFVCPASQSDVSVYGDLLFVSGEGLGGRLDCGTDGVEDRVSEDRLRGIRIFDISDITNPLYISNVQTCRGSHTHSVLVDPADEENVYVYVSGSAPVRPEEELPGCTSGQTDENPETAMFRIEVIQVPLANPAAAAIVNSPRIFEGLVAPPQHGPTRAEREAVRKAKEEGAYVAFVWGQDRIISGRWLRNLLNQVVQERGGEGAPTAADSLALRENLQARIDAMMGGRIDPDAERPGPNQCHDITLYPEVGLAGGACEGYGILLDITNPAAPYRLDAVADSNFAYWHSATFNNEGTSVVFTDEWGGGMQPKCRDTDPYEWGANAIFSIRDGQMEFESYFKMPATQTTTENCVAHNGSLIPVPGRDIMVQGWYQGGINLFDFTDPANPVEIAFHDRGPLSETDLTLGGSWSVYWYNGYIVNSEIARGLDIFELVPSDFITQNEIDAANTVVMAYKNAQGQPKYQWPASFAKARAYLDQLERNRELDMRSVTMLRGALDEAEQLSGKKRASLLRSVRGDVDAMMDKTSNRAKLAMFSSTVEELEG